MDDPPITLKDGFVIRDGYSAELDEVRSPVSYTHLDVYKRQEVGLVATNDAHYINREDSATQSILVCIQTGRTVNDPSDLEFQTDQFYIKSLEEMRQAIPDVDEAFERCV